MVLNIKKYEDVIVVYLNGRFDVHSTRTIEKPILQLIYDETSNHLVFNLSDVEYISSSTLGLFITITRIYKERRKKFIICNINSSVKKILKVVELTSLFHILETEGDALEYISNADLIHNL